jgi:DNA adenine methylase
MQFATPLRYPGGKSRLVQFVADVMRLNHLREGHYVEPYSGGAGIAITLLLQEFVRVVHLNDIDRSVYAFWWACLNDTEALCKKIADTRVSIAEWRRQRRIHRDPDSSLLDLGFATFFLNRTNVSGILHGGVIGGLKQKGEWGIAARYNKAGLVGRIERISSFGGRIKIYNQDAAHFIKRTLPKLPAQALVYLDPPYYVKGAELYENHYEHGDHQKIAKLVQSTIGQSWLVSYDNVAPVRKLYKGFRQIKFGINYSAGRYAMGSEVMIPKQGLLVPRKITPSRGFVRPL